MNIQVDKDDIRGAILGRINQPVNGEAVVQLKNDNPKSIWIRIVDSVSWGIAYYLNSVLQYVFASIFPQTSDRYALRYHLAEEGLQLRSATKAKGIVWIGSKTKPVMRRDIPLNFVVLTSGKSPLYFETIESAYIDSTTPVDEKGYYTVPVAVQSKLPGASNNAPAETVVLYDTVVDGIDVVYNLSAMTDGADEESIAAAYQRLKDSKAGRSTKTMSWFESEAENNFDNVESAWCVPRYDGPGTVGLIISGRGGDVSEETLRDIEDYFNRDEIDPAGAYRVICVRPQNFYQDFDITVWYDPYKGVPEDSALRIAIETYLSNLQPGADQILSVISARLLGIGLKDVRIDSPTSNVVVPALTVSKLGTVTWTKLPYSEA